MIAEPCASFLPNINKEWKRARKGHFGINDYSQSIRAKLFMKVRCRKSMEKVTLESLCSSEKLIQLRRDRFIALSNFPIKFL